MGSTLVSMGTRRHGGRYRLQHAFLEQKHPGPDRLWHSYDQNNGRCLQMLSPRQSDLQQGVEYIHPRRTFERAYIQAPRLTRHSRSRKQQILCPSKVDLKSMCSSLRMPQTVRGSMRSGVPALCGRHPHDSPVRAVLDLTRNQALRTNEIGACGPFLWR